MTDVEAVRELRARTGAPVGDCLEAWRWANRDRSDMDTRDKKKTEHDWPNPKGPGHARHAKIV